MAKLTANERKAWEKDLGVLRAAVSQCEQVLKEDDECIKSAAAESDVAVIKTIVGDSKCIGDGRSENDPARIASARGVYGIREAGGVRISDVVHGRDRDRK